MKSFDFYDTLFVRLVAEPRGVFLLIEALLVLPGFTQLRHIAERKANAKSPQKEITLVEIYDCISLNDAQRVAAYDLELLIETQLLSPVVGNIAKVSIGDVIISDMYLPKSVLESAIKTHFPYNNQPRVFVSSELGSRKSDGSLWRSLIREDVKPLLHLGDNPVSDFRRPLKYGIPAELFDGAALNRFERGYLGDGLDGNLIAGISRAARLSIGEGVPNNSHLNTSCLSAKFISVIAPVLVSFVENVLDECIRKGTKEIFFLARDGQLLYRIANKIIAQRKVDIRIHYIFGSRQALHMAGYCIPAHACKWLFEDTPGLSIAEIAARAQLPPDKFKNAARKLGIYDLHASVPKELRGKLPDLLNDKDVAEALASESNRQWALAIDYYRSVGLVPGSTVALVDVGWTGRMQASLRSILDKEGTLPTRIRGYYLCLSSKLVTSTEDTLSGFLYDPDNGGSSCPFDPYRPVIEASLSADHGSTIGFHWLNGKAEPSYGAEPINPFHDAVLRQQEAVLAFVDAMLKVEQTTGYRICWPTRTASQNLLSMLQSPTKDDALAFLTHALDVQQVEGQRMKLIDHNFSLRSLTKRQKLPLWPEGSAAFTESVFLLFTVRFLRYIRRILKFGRIFNINRNSSVAP
jgi:hypothetical protein